MGVHVGIVGKPNVGKSTFFAAATLSSVETADYPFTTVDPNQGVAHVRTECPCKAFGVKCQPRNSLCIDGNRFVPVELIDVAGLVPGAHEGRGLGNKFLDDLRQASVLIHVVDVSGSTDEEGRPCDPGTREPTEDVKFLERELDEWIADILRRDWDRTVKRASLEKIPTTEVLKERLAGIGVSAPDVESAMERAEVPSDLTKWSDKDIRRFAREVRRVNKPMVIAANKIDVERAEENLKRLEEEVEYPVVPTCAEAELALRRAADQGLIRYLPGDSDFEILEEEKLSDEQLQALEFIREKVLKRWGSTGVQEALNRAVFDVARMIVVYPVENEDRLSDSEGKVLPDALLLPEGTTVRELAYNIHTEIGESFNRAILVKPDGSREVVGEDHELEHGDVVKIQTS
ncbi:redox-regulated ATPase YchF [Methanopyrus sp.]